MKIFQLPVATIFAATLLSCSVPPTTESTREEYCGVPYFSARALIQDCLVRCEDGQGNPGYREVSRGLTFFGNSADNFGSRKPCNYESG